MALPLRSEIDDSLKWKIEDLFANDDNWKDEYERLKGLLSVKPEYKGRLSESAEVLLKALRAYDELELSVERVYVYANQKYYEDTANSFYQDYAGKAQALISEFSEVYSFIEPEILAMDTEMLNSWINGGVLMEFTQHIKNLIRSREHILSDEMEACLAGASEMSKAARDIFSSFNNADARFGSITDADGNEIEITHGRYGLLMESPDRNVRKEAFKKLYALYESYKNTLASMYQANVKQAVFFAKMRKFNSTLEASLNDSNIPVKVYDNLIETVNDNLSLMHRYVSLRKRALMVDELHMYDVYAPLVKDVSCRITFEEAKKTVIEGLSLLGRDYIRILKEGYGNGWIDVCENQGKRSGAFSWGAYGTHPYVFLNYQENLDNMFTLAHEMGHAIHTYKSNDAQKHVNSGYSIFVAEVASTCNEALLIRYLISKSSDVNEKMYLINHFLEQFKGTMFRQTMFAEFERVTHALAEEGTTLTADVLCEVYRGLNEKYFGSDMVIDKEIEMEWSRIPHFYTPFYVYQYATGFAAAVSISGKILNEGEGAVAGYMDFLSSGSSDYPIEVLKKAGVDMEKPDAINGALMVFGKLLDEFEELLNKLNL